MNSDPTEYLGRQIARLNPSHVKFDIGAGGGTPSLTPQDIAAAVGMVHGELGRELLMHVHWPNGARRNRQKLLDLLTMAQLGEYNRREGMMASALCQVATCDPADHARAHTTYSRAHAARWPLWVVKLDPMTIAMQYGRIRLSVLEELTHPRRCPICEGRDLKDRKGAPRTCDNCMGQGVVAYGPSWRSKRLGMKRAGFNARWSTPYQWLVDLAQEQLQDAQDQLSRVLRQ